MRRNACWIRSSIVLIAPASRPASAWSPGSGIRAVRSPRLVIMSAVLAIRSSGARPRLISQRPPTASRASRIEPVISSAATRPRTSLPTALFGRAISRMLVPAGTRSWLCAASVGRDRPPDRGHRRVTRLRDAEQGPLRIAPLAEVLSRAPVGQQVLDQGLQLRRGRRGRAEHAHLPGGDVDVDHAVPAGEVRDLGQLDPGGQRQVGVELALLGVAQHHGGDHAHDDEEQRGHRDQPGEEPGPQREPAAAGSEPPREVASARALGFRLADAGCSPRRAGCGSAAGRAGRAYAAGSSRTSPPPGTGRRIPSPTRSPAAAAWSASGPGCASGTRAAGTRSATAPPGSRRGAPPSAPRPAPGRPTVSMAPSFARPSPPGARVVRRSTARTRATRASTENGLVT